MADNKFFENLGITKEDLEREMAIFCDCEKPGDVHYVEGWFVPKIGYVDHHGWICDNCRKYVQVG